MVSTEFTRCISYVPLLRLVLVKVLVLEKSAFIGMRVDICLGLRVNARHSMLVVMKSRGCPCL